MLEFKITINDDGKDAENQARAVVAGLVGFYGAGIIPGNIRYGGKFSDNLAQSAAIPAWAADAPAPDGYPTETPQYTTAPTSLQEAQERHDEGNAQPTTTTSPTGDRDTAGIPWDERIHASTKTTNKDGTWTRRRNTKDEDFDAVMAELKGAAPVATPAIPAPPAPAAEPTASEAFGDSHTVPVVPVVVPAPSTPQVGAVPPAPAATGGAPTFLTLMQKITPLQGAGKLDKPTLDAFLLDCGIEGLGKMAAPGLDDARIKMGKILDEDDDTRAAIAASDGENRAALLAMVWA